MFLWGRLCWVNSFFIPQLWCCDKSFASARVLLQGLKFWGDAVQGRQGFEEAMGPYSCVWCTAHVMQCVNKEDVMHEAYTYESFKNKNDSKQMGKLH